MDGRAGHLDGSGARLEQTGDRPHRGGLARAVVADDRHALAGGDLERQVPQRFEAAVPAA